MIAVVQRVSEASVSVAETDYYASIGRGLCVLVAVEVGDGEAQAVWMASKLARLRIFPDDDGKMNRSVIDVGGAVLLISQFTLVGECDRGTRPSFTGAAPPHDGNHWYEAMARLLRTEHRLPVSTGVFGASMQVRLTNEGPVTLIVRRSPQCPTLDK